MLDLCSYCSTQNEGHYPNENLSTKGKMTDTHLFSLIKKTTALEEENICKTLLPLIVKPDCKGQGRDLS